MCRLRIVARPRKGTQKLSWDPLNPWSVEVKSVWLSCTLRRQLLNMWPEPGV
jgi:hypothetical protein